EEGEKVPGDQHPAMTAMRTGKITGPVVRGVFVPERNEYVWLSITATPLFHPGEDKAFQVYSIFDDITVFKKHQDKIKEQQQLINTIIERLPIGIALNSVKPQVRFEVINDNFARFYGVSKEALLQPDMFWDAVYEDETFREEIRSRVLSDMESGDPEKMKWHDIPITKEGHIVNYVSAQNIPLKDSDLVISTVWDVTDQKLAKQALKDSETKYRTLFETANDAIIIMDAETIIECNKRTEELYGRTKEQIIGRRPWELSPEFQPDGSDSEKTALDKIRTVLQGEKQFFEWRHVRGNGSLFDVEVSLNDYSINDKPYIQAIIRDITARKKAEAEILRAKKRAEENEARFKTLFDKSPLSIYIHDKDTGDIVDANEQAYSSYGFANVEELRRHDIWLQPPYSVKEAKQWINKTVQEGAQQFEWKNKHISGEIFWELVTLRPIKINGVERILAAAIDITDKKHKEIKEEVLYNIANATFLTNDIKELTLIIKKQLSKLIDTTNFYIALYDKDSGCLSAPYESDEKDQIETWPAKGSMTGLVVGKKKTFLVKKPEILKLISKGVIDQIGN
ncbi:PAS domain S-box protein, partial [Methanosalsum natronophilum]